MNTNIDIEFNDAIGYRSPCVSLQQYHGSTSPANQGRSVREFEDQMAALRKENFNLKLRLYFIEESIPGYHHNAEQDDQELIMKQLIDSKVEMEMLRKEIQEKQDLLKEAALAMNQMEKYQREAETKYQYKLDELTHKMCYLETEREEEKCSSSEILGSSLRRLDTSESLDAAQRICDLESIVKQSEEKVNDCIFNVRKSSDILAKRDETIKEYEEKVKELVFQNNELLETLELKEREYSDAERLIKSLRQSNAELKHEIPNIQETIKFYQENFFFLEILRMQMCERKFREQQRDFENMQMQFQHIREELIEHKTQLADKICMVQEAEEMLQKRSQIHEQACRTIQKLMLKIKNQKDEINRLKNQNLTQCSNQCSANKSTNECGGRECTRLSRSLSDSEAINNFSGVQRHQLETRIEHQEATINNLRAEVKKKTANLQNLVNKELWEKNREIERLIKLINKSPSVGPISPGADELQKSFSDVECTKAVVLNKLLQRKVGVLVQRFGVDRNNEGLVVKLRHDLHEAQMTTERAEKWRRECTDVCAILSNRLEELAGFLNSLLKYKDVLGVLAADRRRAIRKAVDRSLNLSKSLNMTFSFSGLSIADQSLTQQNNLSEILGDEEGINTTFNSREELLTAHSMEALKTENKALKKELDKRRCADSKNNRRSLPLPAQSESEEWSEPDRKVSLARIGLEDPSTSLANELQSQEADTESESDVLTQSRISKTRSQERIQQLEQKVSQREDRILEVQCMLVETDNRLKKENLHVLELTQEREDLRQRNEELHTDLIMIGTNEHISNMPNESLLMCLIEEKTRSMEKMQEECDRITIQARLAEIEMKHFKASMDELKINCDRALTNATEQENQKLEQLRSELKILMEQKLAEKERLHVESLTHDWVMRSIYVECTQQLSELQLQYVDSQRTIDYLNENEHHMKQKLVDTELNMRSLKKQLDDSTLQASKAILERSKAQNEKLALEKQLQELFQRISTLEMQRNTLQWKGDHLEKHQIAATSELNGSEVSHSGYTSEEVAASTVTQRLPSVNANRLNNSSPDLGIESDAGRVSSMDLLNAQCPLQNTVEFSVNSSGNNVTNKKVEENIDGCRDFNKLGPQTANDILKHNCSKIEQENADLRRKLVRTKRAFEDTYEKLRIANLKKAQIEKDIKNQILKTHNVLKNVRSNMENEL